MTLVGIPLDEQAAIFATVASVLHLGNISFSEGPEESSQLASADAKAHLEAAARLLGVPSDGLLKALTTRTRNTFDGQALELEPWVLGYLALAVTEVLCQSRGGVTHSRG